MFFEYKVLGNVLNVLEYIIFILKIKYIVLKYKQTPHAMKTTLKCHPFTGSIED